MYTQLRMCSLGAKEVALTRAKQLSTAATSLAPKLHMRSWAYV